jgi:nucleotide-binding universal stress UspA family protein
MSLGGAKLIQARRDFHQARQRAAMERVLAGLTGRPAELLSFQEVYERLKATVGADKGLHEIPLDAIVGSVGRYQDFSRTFLPRRNADELRWVNVKTAVGARAIDALPPIKVYKIGEAYFVQDGHHRISIARQSGQSSIQAYVTEVLTRAPLTAGVGPDELIVKSEYAAFLEYTQLDRLRPGAELALTIPGRYARFEAHIEAHRFMAEMAQGREIDWRTAVATWYDEAYLPVLAAIREQNILRDFPGRTEADLYLWISDHQLAIRQELGWPVRPEVAAVNLARYPADTTFSSGRVRGLLSGAHLRLARLLGHRHKPGVSRWHQEKLVTRYSAALFSDLLVPFSGDGAGWPAFEQAVLIAQRECATVHGLLVLDKTAAKQAESTAAIRATFERRCREAGVEGHLSAEAGRPAAVVRVRSSLVDLIVLDRHYGNRPGNAHALSVACQALARGPLRPLLIVTQTPSAMARPLLVLDSSLEARDALFVAAYLAEMWQRPLHVLAHTPGSRAAAQTLAYARRYLRMHEVDATFITSDQISGEALLETAAAHHNDLIVAAGRSLQSRAGALLHRPNALLAHTNVPLLICG